LLWKLLIY